MKRRLWVQPCSGITAGLLLLAGCTRPAGQSTPHRLRMAFAPAPEPFIRQVADRVLADFPTPPPFDWGEGVLMAGMMRAGATLNEPAYVAFVQRWADHWQQRGLAPVLEGGSLRGYCGHWGPGYAVAMLYENTPNPSYLAMVQLIAEFINTQATRTADGGLGHWNGNRQLWVDTLYMVCPTMTKLSRLVDQPELMNEPVRQLQVYARHCQDPHTGLFWHMYDEPGARLVGELWGRGNGWVIMSYVEVLKNLPEASPDRRELGQALSRLVKGLVATQDPQTGLWHTVLNRPITYLETSASAMILCGLAEGRRVKCVHLTDAHVLQWAWAGLVSKVDAQGCVIGVSGGTRPASYAEYAAKPVGTETWGTGAFLLAASALCPPS